MRISTLISYYVFEHHLPKAVQCRKGEDEDRGVGDGGEHVVEVQQVAGDGGGLEDAAAP